MLAQCGRWPLAVHKSTHFWRFTLLARWAIGHAFTDWLNSTDGAFASAHRGDDRRRSVGAPNANANVRKYTDAWNYILLATQTEHNTAAANTYLYYTHASAIITHGYSNVCAVRVCSLDVLRSRLGRGGCLALPGSTETPAKRHRRREVDDSVTITMTTIWEREFCVSTRVFTCMMSWLCVTGFFLLSLYKQILYIV